MLPDVGLTPQESSILASIDANLLLKPTFKNSLRDYIVKKVAKERNIAKSHQEYFETEMKRLGNKLK